MSNVITHKQFETTDGRMWDDEKAANDHQFRLNMIDRVTAFLDKTGVEYGENEVNLIIAWELCEWSREFGTQELTPKDFKKMASSYGVFKEVKVH